MPPEILGTYTAPAVRRGDRVTCLYRDAECVVTGTHGGRVPWPRVRALGHRGGSGLWVNEELARAVRTESAATLVYWFGVSGKAAWCWRKALGVVGKFGTEGSARLHEKASAAGGEGMKAKEWTDEDRDQRAERSKRLGLKPTGRWAVGGWTAEQLAALGTAPDDVLAARFGKSVDAVRLKRTRLKVRKYRARPEV